MKTNRENILLVGLLAAFVVLLTLPWLVPHVGGLALFAFVPLLCAERIASMRGIKRFWWWYFTAFLVFNALTSWWICKATVGGGIFAVVAMALYMSGIFALFRGSKKVLSGVLPYIFLMFSWIAFEKFQLTLAQLAWPWLSLGNAFARSTHLIQWYEWTGMLGGSLWVWLSNLSIFGLMVALSDGRFNTWTKAARISSVLGLALVFAGPMITSAIIEATYEERSEEGTLDVVMAQSNFDPWQKLRRVPQSEQNAQVIGLFEKELQERAYDPVYPDKMTLMVLPETFCHDIWYNNPHTSATWRSFDSMIARYPNVNLLFGASTHELFNTAAAPTIRARRYGDSGWYTSYNAALMMDQTGRLDRVHKSKLVVGTELTPYPKIFVPLDNALGGVMGRCEIQGYAKCLSAKEYDYTGMEVKRTIKIGVPICYESIYGDFCRGYVNDGATMLAVITNDGWWGNTPGYRQHFSYSRLRAIELRRDIARCANTGISAFIDQKGNVLEQSGWWVPDTLHREVNLTSHKTFFAIHGDIVGRVCTFAFVLLLLSLLVRAFTRKK